MIDTQAITKAFNDVGARAVFFERQRRRWQRGPQPLRVDVASDRRGEHFTFRVDPERDNDLAVLDLRPSQRHLVLMLTDRDDAQPRAERSRLLCGHDERHWFVAALPPEARVTTVTQAMEALKPPLVRDAQLHRGVGRDDRNRRRNKGFVRQGEWFFIPDPGFDAAGLVVHRHEPLRRGTGKPHFAEELVRSGGESVRFNNFHRNGLNEAEFEALLTRDPKARAQRWEVGIRNPDVRVRGYVRHPDHATIHLAGWHQVVLNTEDRIVAGPRFVGFID